MEKYLLNKLLKVLKKALQKEVHPVAAFDADGTLWPHDVGKSFFQYQVENHLLDNEQYRPKGANLIQRSLNMSQKNSSSDPQGEFNRIREKSGRKQALIWLAKVQAGYSLSQLNQWIEAFLKKNPFKMFKFQQRLIEWLLHHKVEIFVVSSSLKWVLDQALSSYNIPSQNIIGVQTQVENGRITDKPILPAPIYKDKVKSFQAVAKGRKPLLVSGNTLADQALLEFSSQHQLVVTGARPGERNYESERKLLNIAIKRGWFYYDISQE